MRLNSISPARGSKKEKKRVGRGSSSGWGKTSGRGQKGKNQDLEAECVQGLKEANCLFKRGFLLLDFDLG